MVKKQCMALLKKQLFSVNLIWVKKINFLKYFKLSLKIKMENMQ